jgi:hypothetical protein
MILQIMIQVIDTISNLNFTSYSVFMNTISDPSCNGMYLSFLNAFSNIPSLLFNPFFVRLLSLGALKPSIAILIISIVYSFGILDTFTTRLGRLRPKDFHLILKKTS